MTTSVTALHKSSFNWEGVRDECGSWKLGNAVNILEESSSESSTIKLLSVMAVAIKSLWAAWKLFCSTLNQQQQRIKVIIIEAAHVAVYIIATRVAFFPCLLALSCFMTKRCICHVCLRALKSTATWNKATPILWYNTKSNHVCSMFMTHDLLSLLFQKINQWLN